MPRTLPRSNPRSPEGFEAFYKDVRGRLLLQTYALTGDLHAAQRAVRDAMVVAWHHWRKVSRLEQPEDYVRPLAWTRAQRRSSARWWARQKDLDAETRATLDALAKLSTTQRKVLLLTHLTALPIDDMSREVGVTRASAERELQTASAQFAVHREVPSTAIRGVLEAIAPALESVRWPRPSIVMRAGSARRARAHRRGRRDRGRRGPGVRLAGDRRVRRPAGPGLQGHPRRQLIRSRADRRRRPRSPTR